MQTVFPKNNNTLTLPPTRISAFIVKVDNKLKEKKCEKEILLIYIFIFEKIFRESFEYVIVVYMYIMKFRPFYFADAFIIYAFLHLSLFFLHDECTS